MRIAYLILCHKDPQHIARLVNKITDDNADAFIHIDVEVDDTQFKQLLDRNEYVYFVKDRIKPYWGGFSAVEATMKLIDLANDTGIYDRYILLQGADYPLKSNNYILNFFENNRDIEFIKGVETTNSKNYYLYSKSRMYWFFDKKNFWRKILNRLNRITRLKTRKGYVVVNNEKYNIFWGAAQWALTRECIEYISYFYKNNINFNRYFKHVFPVDETYFHTIVLNSKFRNKANLIKEESVGGLESMSNLHYFEYPDLIKVFTEEDYDFLIKKDCLFIRKTTTEKSSILLDMIDKVTEEGFQDKYVF